MNKTICKSDDNRIRGIIREWSGQKENGFRLFYLAFIVFVCGETLTTTMFPIPGKVFLFCKLLPILLVGVKFLWFDQFAKKELLAIIVTVIITLAVFVSSGYMEPFLWVVMIIGAKDVSWRKILQIFIAVSLSIILLAFCASLLNVIENLQYLRDDDLDFVRNSFGTIYTTDFAAHIFVLLLATFCLLKEKIKVWHIVTGCALATFVYIFCLTRLDVGCMYFLLILFSVITFRKKKKAAGLSYATGGFVKKIAWFMPAAAVLMFLVTAAYSKSSSLFVSLDGFMSGRLSLGHQGLVKYGVSFFGQQIKMIGNGGTAAEVKNYFFVDCSYLYVFLRYGLLFLCVVLGVYVLCCRKYQDDWYFLAAIVLISINCMIAHHLIELAYNPFALALLANGKADERNRFKRIISG